MIAKIPNKDWDNILEELRERGIEQDEDGFLTNFNPFDDSKIHIDTLKEVISLAHFVIHNG